MQATAKGPTLDRGASGSYVKFVAAHNWRKTRYLSQFQVMNFIELFNIFVALGCSAHSLYIFAIGFSASYPVPPLPLLCSDCYSYSSFNEAFTFRISCSFACIYRMDKLLENGSSPFLEKSTAFFKRRRVLRTWYLTRILITTAFFLNGASYSSIKLRDNSDNSRLYWAAVGKLIPAHRIYSHSKCIPKIWPRAYTQCIKSYSYGAVILGKLASPFVRVERDSDGTRARMDLLCFPK